MVQGKKSLIYLMIIQELNLNLFVDQNMIKLKEQDLKYLHLNKCFKDYQYLLHK